MRAPPCAQIFELLSARKLRRHLVLGVILQLSMQFSGIDAVFYYSTMAFRQAGVADPQMATTFLGALNVVLTVIAIAIMDRLGRRTLLLISWVGMALSYSVLTYSLALGQDGATEMHAVSVLAMAGVISSFAIGPGAIAWFVIAEIFPAYAMDAAMAMGVMLNWLANISVAFTFPLLHAKLGAFSFLIFAFTTAGFGLFTWWYARTPRDTLHATRPTASHHALSHCVLSHCTLSHALRTAAHPSHPPVSPSLCASSHVCCAGPTCLQECARDPLAQHGRAARGARAAVRLLCRLLGRPLG